MVCGFPTAQGSLARWDNPSVMNRKAHFTRYKNLSNSSEQRASFDRRSPITTRFALIKCLITPIFAPLPAQSHESPNSSLDSGPCLVKIHIHKPENIHLNQFHLLEAGTNPAQAQGSTRRHMEQTFSATPLPWPRSVNVVCGKGHACVFLGGARTRITPVICLEKGLALVALQRQSGPSKYQSPVSASPSTQQPNTQA